MVRTVDFSPMRCLSVEDSGYDFCLVNCSTNISCKILPSAGLISRSDALKFKNCAQPTTPRLIPSVNETRDQTFSSSIGIDCSRSSAISDFTRKRTTKGSGERKIGVLSVKFFEVTSKTPHQRETRTR